MFETMLQDVYNLLSNVSINQSTIEKIVTMSSNCVAMRERWSRVLVIGYKTEKLNLGAKLLSDPL